MTDNILKKDKSRVRGGCFPATFIYFLISLAIFVIDQLIKLGVRSSMSLGEKHQIIGDLFSINYIENRGAAFSSFSGQYFMLHTVTSLMLVTIFFALLFMAYKKPPIFGIALGLMGGGGAANLLDRIRFNSVTDYLSLKHFAVFNFADMAIVIGCGLLIIWMFFFDKKKEDYDD